jgi:hypothetical protein
MRVYYYPYTRDSSEEMERCAPGEEPITMTIEVEYDGSVFRPKGHLMVTKPGTYLITIEEVPVMTIPIMRGTYFVSTLES